MRRKLESVPDFSAKASGQDITDVKFSRPFNSEAWRNKPQTANTFAIANRDFLSPF